MLVKTSELSGVALDWAVAKCEGFRAEKDYQYTDEKKFNGWWQCGPNHWQPLCKYSTKWAQGGPIIEREGIYLWRPYGVGGAWSAKLDDWQPDRVMHADKPLIAAMRCYIASKLGDTVEIPDELIN